jgi:hypothetical protein
MNRKTWPLTVVVAGLLILAAGWLALSGPARAQFNGGGPGTVFPGGRSNAGPTPGFPMPAPTTIPVPTAGGATAAAEDGKGNVVLSYPDGLVAIVTPQSGQIHVYRIYADGAIDDKPPLKRRMMPFTPQSMGGGFPGG